MQQPELNVGLLFVSGTTVPVDATAGYQTGCIFQHTDGTTGTAFYVNEGSVTSCDFNEVAGITAAQELLLTATPGTIAASKAVIANSDANIGAVKATSLSVGTTGAEVAITATPAQLNTLAGASAGIAAVLAGGLGASVAYAKTKNDTTTLLAAHATNDRACLVVAVVNEVFATAAGTQPTFTVGEADDADLFFAAATFVDAAAGSVFVSAAVNNDTKAITVTGTAAVGAATGGITVTVIAIPTT
jgi:hypothetical protein